MTGLDALTGLPEYRNGGCCSIPACLPARAGLEPPPWQAGTIFIVEWRALTVALLDELAPLVRAELGLSAAQMPLACVLEGAAPGRPAAPWPCASAWRPARSISKSDGTVF